MCIDRRRKDYLGGHTVMMRQYYVCGRDNSIILVGTIYIPIDMTILNEDYVCS